MKFESKVLIEKGWSGDQKYCVTKDENKYLLRISPVERYENRLKLHSLLNENSLNIEMCESLEVTSYDDGVYSLQTWIDGIDADQAIRSYSKEDQYKLGYESGRILKEIHKIPAPDNQVDWYERFNDKMDLKIKKYKDCPLSFDGDHYMIDYIEKHRDLLKDRPQTFQHGDYHIGNMMIRNHRLVIIDFDRYDFGDPWEEFNRIVWCAQVSPEFASGQIDGYFDGNPPLEFFKLLALYISSNTLSSIYWAIPFGQKDVDTMMSQSQEILSWYDDMKNPMPAWYKIM